MLAVRTQAFKVYGEVSNLEAGATHVEQWQSTKLRIVEINNLITANADQMVVTLGVAVKSSGTSKCFVLLAIPSSTSVSSAR